MAKTPLDKLVRHVSPFERLGNFFEKFQLLNYKKGETILRDQDPPPGVFYIKSGYVSLYSICEEGDQLTLVIFKPQDFFPVMWAVNNTPNEYYLEALTDVELWRAPKKKFQEFIRRNPDVLYEITSRMLTRLGGVLKRMEHLVFGSAHSKVASILAICAERFGKKRKGELVIDVLLTHRDIACLVGLTRETASIEIKKLERKGLISYQKRLIVVKNLLGLKRESLLK